MTAWPSSISTSMTLPVTFDETVARRRAVTYPEALSTAPGAGLAACIRGRDRCNLHRRRLEARRPEPEASAREEHRQKDPDENRSAAFAAALARSGEYAAPTGLWKGLPLQMMNLTLMAENRGQGECEQPPPSALSIDNTGRARAGVGLVGKWRSRHGECALRQRNVQCSMLNGQCPSIEHWTSTLDIALPPRPLDPSPAHVVGHRRAPNRISSQKKPGGDDHPCQARAPADVHEEEDDEERLRAGDRRA